MDRGMLRAFFGRAVCAASALALVIALAAAAPCLAAETLTLADCLAIAEAYHPDIAAAAASVSSDIASLRAAAVAERLTINATASQGRSASDHSAGSSSFSAGANASVRLFDSRRTRLQIESRREALAATRESAEQTRRDVRAEVKLAYISLLLSERTVEARESSARAWEEHLEQARGFYEAGTRALSDVTKAEVDLGNARLALVQAQSDLIMDKAALQNAMGVSISEDFNIAPAAFEAPMTGEYWELSSSAEEETYEAALAHRADYAAGLRREEANRVSLAAAARQNSPVITLSGGYSAGGTHIGNAPRGWNTALTLSVPIADGGSSAAATDAARASLASSEASNEKLRQQILLGVRQVLNELRTARERITIAELTEANAEENFRLASGRYETGVGTALELTDALVSLTDAKLTMSIARSALSSAVVALERVTGVEFDEGE